MGKNLVVIIILNLDKINDTLKCLDSVVNLDYHPFEIVVVDNGSRDNSAIEINRRFPKIHLIESRFNLGVSGGRNLALNYIKDKFDYRYILFLCIIFFSEIWLIQPF